MPCQYTTGEATEEAGMRIERLCRAAGEIDGGIGYENI